MTAYTFRLYVTGETIRSQSAEANLRRLCEAHASGRYEVSVIDVLKEPDVAESEGIIATPVVVRLSPAPLRRVVGDLSDLDLAASALGLAREHRPDGPGSGG